MTPKLITIVGPTAIGKTALSLKIAKHFNCDIVSADSRQFYKEMSIGTAVPSLVELNEVNHHFIQHISISESYSVGDFEKDAISRITELHQANPYTVLVGGSGLYVKAVTDGFDDFPAVDSAIRKELNKRWAENGLAKLQDELKLLDKIAYETIAIDNPHRVIRALEICKGTGKPYSSFLSKPKKKRKFDTIFIGLQAERETLYNRINTRVDLMIGEGLLEEVRQLLPYRNLNALNTVGYKELFNYFDGSYDLDFAIAEIKKNTRRFAKRQMTWFKKNKNIKWFDYAVDKRIILDYIESKKKV